MWLHVKGLSCAEVRLHRRGDSGRGKIKCARIKQVEHATTTNYMIRYDTIANKHRLCNIEPLAPMPINTLHGSVVGIS